MDYNRLMQDMIETQIIARGVTDPHVLRAIEQVPRHMFVSEDQQAEAYEDHPLTLPEEKATISQPYMVAYMTKTLQCKPKHKVLEIGTGSGYQAAILSRICREVYTVERHYSLSVNAQRTLQSMGIENVYFNVGDGIKGWEEKAPFDRIIVTAAAQNCPQTFLDQLKEDGKILIPLGSSQLQTLTRIHKKGDQIESTPLLSCVFVPLIPCEE